jgi:hypothetical protein
LENLSEVSKQPACQNTMSCFPDLKWPYCNPDDKEVPPIYACGDSRAASQDCCLSEPTPDKGSSNCPPGWESSPAQDQWCTDSQGFIYSDSQYRHKCRRVSQECSCNGARCDATQVCAPYAGCQSRVPAESVPVQVLDVVGYYNGPYNNPNQTQITIYWTTSLYPIKLEQFAAEGTTFEMVLMDEEELYFKPYDVTPANTSSYVYTAGDQAGLNVFETTFVFEKNDFSVFPFNSLRTLFFYFLRKGDETPEKSEKYSKWRQLDITWDNSGKKYCDSQSTCACGRSGSGSYRKDEQECCDTGQVCSNFGKWCSNYEDNYPCRHNCQCIGGECNNGKCRTPAEAPLL